jgi:histone H3/H4
MTAFLSQGRVRVPKRRRNPPMRRDAVRSKPLGRNKGSGHHHFRPRTVVLREIRKYHRSRRDHSFFKKKEFFDKNAMILLIPKATFQKLVKEIMKAIKSDSQITVRAITALQTAAEDHLTGIFQDSNLLAFHRQRTTVNPAGMCTAIWICRDLDSRLTESEKSEDSVSYVFLTRTNEAIG